MDTLRRRAAAEAKQARQAHARDVAQNAALLAQLTEARQEVHPSFQLLALRTSLHFCNAALLAETEARCYHGTP